MDIRVPGGAELRSVMALAADVLGPERVGPFVRSHLDRHLVLAMADARKQQICDVGTGNQQHAGYGER